MPRIRNKHERHLRLTEVLDVEHHGADALYMAIVLGDCNGMRAVATAMALSGWGLADAKSWLQRTLPGHACLQYMVSEEWHGIDFPCGSRWLH